MIDNKNVTHYFKDYKNKISTLLDKVDLVSLTKILNVILDACKNNNTIYVCGNGGSAATASHIQADFGFFVRYFTEFRPKVIALTDNVPIITAVSNDNNFKDIFVEQLKGNFNKNDILISISASGNSNNLIEAINYVKKLKGISISFVGFDGGELFKISDYCLFTSNNKGDYGPIEDIHMMLAHIIINYLTTEKEFINIKS